MKILTVSRLAVLALCAFVTSCGGPSAPVVERPDLVTLSVVGTNDLHGHVEALPLFAGYLAALRGARAEDGGEVVLLDGGDMFQGTLESNLLEGAPVVTAYAALGYDAVTLGNHEFDYGPVGEAVTPTDPSHDPRGALLARVAQAGYPFLSANLLVSETGERIDWAGVLPMTVFEKAGVRVGVIGVTTESTLSTTIAANVADLAMAPLAASIERHALRLRADGVHVVLVAAHAGGICESFDDPHDLASCEDDQEIFEVARALADGAVDAIVAGHTHRGVAHVVDGVPIIESFSYGRAFGRVDLTVDRRAGRVVDVRVHAPRDLCAAGRLDHGDCVPGSYEGRAIALTDPRIEALLAPAVENARALRAEPLGVTLTAEATASRNDECAVGNLFTDLMLAARPAADVAFTNGGGLRANLPAGALDYGALHTSNPFDNRFALVRLTVGQLAAILADTLSRDGSFYSISGMRAVGRCEDGAVHVTIVDDVEGATPMDPEREITLVTSDFLATGSHSPFATLPEEQVVLETEETIRDAMADALRGRGGELDPDVLFDVSAPRIRFEGARPLSCAP
ncbi:MAG: bifunctional UDP-sugar hydrolase/5'-nucleotidase [Sandaracinaceae bacterium]